ncbi:MAG: hypothetical protein A3D92_06590 [Bacteroidetes bacterium RIFCSPHIGHO2_02_FULL_44_7]|nr:MAG: hypothetical protein A3D92_06590 [Bacteroidetes bacterium RIFCSPHIGHO2_02_FULL_44_7]
MKSVGIFLLMCVIGTSLNAQELNCQVSIISDARLEITTVEKEIFEQMEQAIYELMNNTQWTKDKFTVEERINCNIQLQIREIPTPGTYTGSLQVQSSRPAFNSGYNTTVFNFQDDDIAFTFSRGALLTYAPNQYRDELTSVLAFYAYFIIGMDYDSFSNKGGTKYFTEAQQIVSNAQSSGGTGWSSSAKGKNNRYWIVDNILHELFSPLRECNYAYHRSGIDKMYDDPVTARKSIYEALNRLVKVTATRPNSINLLNFVQAKSTELKNLYSEADVKEKNDIVSLLKRIDPANSPKYQEILN